MDDKLTPQSVYPTDIIGTMFNPSDEVCLRVFADKKGDPFTGTKLSVEAAKFNTLMPTLEQHNQQDRGIFFVVNYGGQTDADIKRINAQFVESDELSLDEQEKQIMAFPLKPSLIIKTRKSLHTYWFIKNGDVSRFRGIQKALVEQFHGDPACVNESRVLRLPGFNHCKEDPVMVECLWFHPENRYTQDELEAHLPKVDSGEPVEVKKGTQAGLEVMIAGCDFIQHCINDAANLPEHDWYAMITNTSVFDGGVEKAHEISQPYPNYNKDETQKKINHFLDSGTGPMTCQVIADKGFKCPKLANGTCDCKSPAAMSFKPLEVDALRTLLQTLPVKNAAVDDLQTAKEFIEKYLYNADNVTAESFINYDVKSHFNFKTTDLKVLITCQKNAVKQHQTNMSTKKNGTGLPMWYEITDKGIVKFLPGILAEEMAKDKAVFYAAGSFYRYEDGVFKEVDELTIKNLVREKMIPKYTKLSQITDATGQWQMQVLKDICELNPNPYIINVKNGLYNVLENKLYEHTKDYLSTVQLQVNFTPGADCPRFMQYLHESVPDDQIPLIQEMLGYFLVPVNHAQKCFVIVGKGGTGKSQLLLLINDILLGRRNVSNVTWQALGNEKFKIAELFGKLANIFADLPSKNIEDNGMFKAIVGEDFITVEKKNKNPFSFQSCARLLFSCNSIPRNYGDKSDAFYRRLIIIRFDNIVPEDKKDKLIQDKFRTEADGIFLFALEGLKRLINNHFTFSETERNKTELESYREDSNSVLSFVNEWCELDASYEIPSMELYNNYKHYCEVCGLSPYAQKRFSQDLENSFPDLKKAKDSLGKRRTWRGIKVSDITE